MCHKITISILCLLWLFVGTNSAQASISSHDWSDWTPESQYKLYINIVDGTDSSQPRLCILDDRNFSWPFGMMFTHDTLYLDIVPPGYKQIESTLDSLPMEIPMVIRAGTERAVYWYSNDHGIIEIDTTLLPATFIKLATVNTLPDSTIYLHLPGKDGHAPVIRKAIKEINGLAKLIQVEDAFYQGIWGPVSKTTIQRFKTNWVGLGTDSEGALLVFKLADPSKRQEVETILKQITH